jgi:hypothetical protein
MKQRTSWLMLLLMCTPLLAKAQGEATAPVRWNPLLKNAFSPKASPYGQKTAAISLPFFEDFTDEALFPSSLRWADSQVYINNTMCVDPIARGVATFDALNKRGRPYDTASRFNSVYADSLTSQVIDLSTNSANDSIYLSFFYQPQGRGFSPEVQDSFMLFFHKKNGGWAEMWAVPGADVQPFRQVMIAVRDTDFFYSTFQFRFVNRATINSNDDVWNLDYIRMGANRTIGDTAVRDLAFTYDPSFLLNDYTAMPYRQYLPNATAERRATMTDTIWNHYVTNSTVNYGFRAVETTTGTPLTNGANTINIPAYSKREVSFPTYSNTVSAPNNYSRIVYRNTFFLQSGNPNEPKDNDTIVREQVFDNYLAYDDGTAEKSYFLNLSSSLPGRTAIEFRLNKPDTLRGMAIYFGQQVPTASGKFFSATVYSKLGGISGGTQDVQLYEQELLLPVFTDTVNRFTIYRFDTPLELPAGVFYLGTTQPANFGSDSLYIGLDVNRVGGNHAYFNVLNAWQPSLISGALMIRPLLGGPVTGTAVHDMPNQVVTHAVYPNPCTTTLFINDIKQVPTSYLIMDIQGRTVLADGYTNEGISVESLPTGMYLLRLRQGDYWGAPQKFIKQ